MSDERSHAVATEQEPLLGRPGDAMQPEGDNILKNLYLGTAAIAQAGLLVLVAIIWGAVFSNKLILFSAHPVLQAAAVFFYVQAILILQPTHTAKQKRSGALWHVGWNSLAFLIAIAGAAIIEYNKGTHARFTSAHGRFGLATWIALFIQGFVGATVYFVPGLYGGVNHAKALYKYHRASGYAIVLLLLATVSAATYTDFNKNVLKIQLWPVIVAAVLVLVGVVPRIRRAKFGL